MLEYDVERILQLSFEMSECIKELQDMMRQAENLIRSVEGDWRGEAEIALQNQLLYAKEQFNEWYILWEDYTEQLKEYAQRCQLLEEQICLRLELV
jgi:uncharacterized protein YukE